MTVKEFYDFITKHMTAEEALMKLLEGNVMEYEKLKFSEKGKEIHPVHLIALAAMDMGWNFTIEGKEVSENIEGLCIGNDKYLERLFPKTNQ